MTNFTQTFESTNLPQLIQCGHHILTHYILSKNSRFLWYLLKKHQILWFFTQKIQINVISYSQIYKYQFRRRPIDIWEIFYWVKTVGFWWYLLKKHQISWFFYSKNTDKRHFLLTNIQASIFDFESLIWNRIFWVKIVAFWWYLLKKH
jgi:hypothetical protein